MEQTAKTDKMGQMPVNKLMLAMGLPMIISMVLQALYNIVDSAFISNMAEDAGHTEAWTGSQYRKGGSHPVSEEAADDVRVHDQKQKTLCSI